MSNLQDVQIKTITGESTSLSTYAGKALLIVNVASKCGFTPQYTGLEALFRRYKDRGFEVLGFPCDQFGHQEPGNEAEISNFCTLTYDVTFPMFAKIEVNGPNTHPLYQNLKKAAPGSSAPSGSSGTSPSSWSIAGQGRRALRAHWQAGEPGKFHRGGPAGLSAQAVRGLPGCAARGLVLALLLGASSPGAVGATAPAPLAELEAAYADFNDAQGAISLIDSDPRRFQQTYGARSRAQWQEEYLARRTQLTAGLPAIVTAGLPPEDVRAIGLMQAAMADSTATPESPAPAGHCSDATQQDLALQPLQAALYACFAELGNDLRFEGGSLTRVAALEMLTHMEEAPRRKDLFMAFVPLWRALNSDGGPSSPYRRMIRSAAAEAKKKGSVVDAAARTVGITPAEVEHWLVRILDAWRQVSGGAELEPWDYRFAGGAAERELQPAVPLADSAGPQPALLPGSRARSAPRR